MGWCEFWSERFLNFYFLLLTSLLSLRYTIPMSLLSFFKTKKVISCRMILFFDIGRGNCRGALCAEIPGQPLSIFHTVMGEERITVREHSKALPLALDSLKAVLGDLLRYLHSLSGNSEYEFKIIEVLCLLSSPYYLAKTTSARFRSEEPFVITKVLVEKLMKEAEAHMQKKLASANPEVMGGGKTIALSKRVVQILANGYPIKNPYGKEAKTLDISFFEAEMSSEVKDSIERIIQSFMAASIHIESLSYATWSAIQLLSDSVKDCLFVTIGKTVSEVSLVRDYSLVQTVSFPHGSHLIVRHVARKLKTTEESAFFRLNLFQEGKLTPEERQKIAVPFEDAKSEWLLFFENAAVSLAGSSLLPSRVYLSIDGDPKGTLSDLISEDSFSSQTLSPKGFETIPLKLQTFRQVCQFDNLTPFDVFLASGACLFLPQAPHKEREGETEQKTSPREPPLSTREKKTSMIQSA